MEKSNFDDLVRRYVTGQVSEQERIKMDIWLDIMKGVNTSDLDLSPEDEEKLYRKITSSKSTVDEIRAFRPWERHIFTTMWITRIAAGLLLIAVVSYTIWHFSSNDNPMLERSASSVEKIKLNDGSLVWVRGDSRLSYYEAPDGRHAELDGQALFEVAKDPHRPFTIRYREVAIRVVGTSFSVKTGDSVEVKVLTGRVHISSDTDQAGVEVDPDEEVVYTSHGVVKTRKLQQADVAALTANTTYNMKFGNATLAEVTESIAKKFDVSVKLEEEDAGACHITINLTGRSLEESLQMLTEVLNIRYEKHGEEITVSGKGC